MAYQTKRKQMKLKALEEWKLTQPEWVQNIWNLKPSLTEMRRGI